MLYYHIQVSQPWLDIYLINLLLLLWRRWTTLVAEWVRVAFPRIQQRWKNMEFGWRSSLRREINKHQQNHHWRILAQSLACASWYKWNLWWISAFVRETCTDRVCCVARNSDRDSFFRTYRGAAYWSIATYCHYHPSFSSGKLQDPWLCSY